MLTLAGPTSRPLAGTKGAPSDQVAAFFYGCGRADQHLPDSGAEKVGAAKVKSDPYLRSQIRPLFQKPIDYAALLCAVLENMICEGVTYCELVFDFSMAAKVGSSWPEITQLLTEHTARFDGKITFQAEIGVSRERAVGDWMTIVRSALDTGYFRGLDLYGTEGYRPIEDFRDDFEEGRRRGLRLKLHSGETESAQRLLHEVNTVKPTAVQHGITAVRDRRVLDALAKMDLTFHVCPTSNVKLGLVPSLAEHPIKLMHEAGLRITLNSDDLGIFRVGLSDEYHNLYRSSIFTAEALNQIRLAGLALTG